MNKKVLFLDGSLMPAKKSLVDSLSPGILAGKGVFETMRSYNGKIFGFNEHMSRLSKGLKSLGILAPFSKEKIKGYIYQALISNRLKNARIRLTVWQGSKSVRISIIVLAYKSYLPSKYKQGFKAIISDIRYDRKEIAPYVKSIDYLSLWAASRAAKKSGNDEAVLLNSRGHIVEGSRTNIFFIKNKTLFTPNLLCGCLCGITRQKVIALAKGLGIKVKEVTVNPEQIAGADEAFLTNSLIGIMPLTSFQGKHIGRGTIGFLTAKLLKSYTKLVLQKTA